jgi:hypothetical protein
MNNEINKRCVDCKHSDIQLHLEPCDSCKVDEVDYKSNFEPRADKETKELIEHLKSRDYPWWMYVLLRRKRPRNSDLRQWTDKCQS